MIRTDCYMAVLQKYMKSFPDAIFEIITREQNHPLSPSWKLLHKSKTEEWSFEKYKAAFLDELQQRKEAQQKITELKEISKKHTVFLVCYEKNPAECHRSIVKELLEDQIPPGEMMFCYTCNQKVRTIKRKDMMYWKWNCSQCNALLRIKYFPVGS